MSKGKVVKKIIHEVVKILPQVPKEVRLNRMRICEKCESKIDTPEIGWTCGKYLSPGTEPLTCGCIVEEKTKLKNFHCPQKFW